LVVLPEGFILFLEMLKFSKKRAFLKETLIYIYIYIFIYLFKLIIYLFLSDKDYRRRIFWNIFVLEMESWKLINYLGVDMC